MERQRKSRNGVSQLPHSLADETSASPDADETSALPEALPGRWRSRMLALSSIPGVGVSAEDELDVGDAGHKAVEAFLFVTEERVSRNDDFPPGIPHTAADEATAPPGADGDVGAPRGVGAPSPPLYCFPAANSLMMAFSRKAEVRPNGSELSDPSKLTVFTSREVQRKARTRAN